MSLSTINQLFPPLEAINTREAASDRIYIAGLHGKKVSLFASSLYAARQRAEAHFKPRKKDMGLLWVELVE